MPQSTLSPDITKELTLEWINSLHINKLQLYSGAWVNNAHLYADNPDPDGTYNNHLIMQTALPTPAFALLDGFLVVKVVPPSLCLYKHDTSTMLGAWYNYQRITAIRFCSENIVKSAILTNQLYGSAPSVASQLVFRGYKGVVPQGDEIVCNIRFKLHAS